MAGKQHPFDVVAEQLQALADRPAAAQEASPDYWEVEVANEEQVVLRDPRIVLTWGPESGLGPDGFPTVPIPEMRLKGRGPWTDVLPAPLPYAWSVAYLLNETALAVFKQFELGTFREYPVTVRDPKGLDHSLTCLLIRNTLPPEAFDFGRSEFYRVDIAGVPQAPVSISSYEDWSEKVDLARTGQLDGCERFSRIQFKKLVIHPDQLPTVDLFRLGRLGIQVYLSARLKEAIASSGITGLAIRPNRRLYAGG